MQLTIDGKNIHTRFGMAFVREVNKNYLPKDSKSKEQYGVMYAYSFLEDENPEGVAEVIYSATTHLESDRPTKNKIDEFLEVSDNLGEICNELKLELEEGVLTKKAVESSKKIIEMSEKTQGKIQKK